MACCTGQTKCNNIVTIGYLSGFVGNMIEDSAGTVVHVNSNFSNPSYCPTYSELTNGSILPKYVDGGENRGASNIDGIAVNGTYRSDQLVNTQDLILVYTRFNRFTLNPSSRISYTECGGSNIIEYVFRLTKTTRGIDSCETGGTKESTEGCFDKVNSTPGKDKITFSVGGNWITITEGTDAKVTATAVKNGTVSMPQRSTNIKASVTYKGQTYESGTLVASQSALTGGYTELEGKYATSITFTTITPSDKKLGCEGGRYTVSSTGNYYTRYRWKDSCDLVYDDVYQDTPGSEALPAQTGVFSAVTCPTETFSSAHTVYVTYSGITSSVTFTQNCSQQCDECKSYTVWGSGNGTATAPCTGASVQVIAEVSGVTHKQQYVDGVCQETGTEPTSERQSIDVIIPVNDTESTKTYTGSKDTSRGGTINYTITQDAPTFTFTFDDITLPCDSASSTSMNARYTRYNNCAETSTTNTTMVNIPSVSCNDSSSKTIRSGKTGSTLATAEPKIIQEGGCQCGCHNPSVSYTFDDITVSCDSGAATPQTASYTKVTTYTDCSPETERSSTTVTIPARECWSDPNSHVIQSGKSGTTLASAQPKIIQAGGCTCTSCTCNDLNVEQVASLPSSSGNNVTIAKYSADCLTNLAVTESANWITNVTSGNGEVKASISANTGDSVRSTTITISGKADGVDCSKIVSVLQNGINCDCDDVTFVTVATTIGSGATPSSGTTIARASYGNCTGSLSGATVSPASATTWLSAFTSGNEVRVRATENTELSNERSGTVRTYYKANSSDSSYNCYKDFDVNQISIPCTCESLKYFITPIKTEFGSGGTHGDTILVASGDTFGCGKLSATTLADIFADENGISPASLITEYLDEKEEKVLFKLRVIEWGSNPNVTWGQEEYKPASVDIFFQPKDESISACTGEAFQVKLYRNKKVQAECNEVTLTTSSITVSCDHRMEGYSQKVASLVPKYSGDTQLEIYRDDRSYIRLSADTNDEHYDWLHVRTFHNMSESYINVYITGDNYPSTSARTEAIDYIIVRGEDNQEEITECDRGQIIVTQEGCTSGDCSGCSEYDLSIDLSSIPYSGETYNLWDYVTGYSFCDIGHERETMPYLDMDVSPSATSYYEFDKSEGTLTVYPNESDESIPFSFEIDLYRNNVYSKEYCLNRTIDATQEAKQEACQCDGWSICQNSRLYPGGIDIQGDKAHSLHLIYRSTSPTHKIEWDEMSGCGCGVDARALSDASSWITVPTFSPGADDITLALAENNGAERSGTVEIFIRGGSGCLEERCKRTVTITQKERCDCSNIMSSQGHYNNVVYYGGGPTYTLSYHPASEYADCISGYTTSASSYYANTSYAYDEFGDVIVVVENMRESMGCEDCYVELGVVKNDGSICYYGDRITLNSKCAYPSAGIFENLDVIVPSTSTGVTAGTLTNSDIGTSYCLCYELIAEPQYEPYFNSISFVPTNQSGTTNPVNYNIVVDCVEQTDQDHSTSILITAKQETCDKHTITIGTITIKLLKTNT